MKKQDEEKKKKSALKYHETGRPGKIEVNATKPTITAEDLSKAYSPGVAFPCLEIAKNPDDVYKYTAKGNLVGVISNGSAVLGLGNIGPLAGKPVMEGKGVLFKKFADIDVFDIEINAKTVEEMVAAIKPLGPTFGGINLEDIKAPECFEVERILKEEMDIPVFHDDQHGTAIISAAGFINACEITNRKIEEAKIVFSGAGAAALSCAGLLLEVGVKPENVIICDSQGPIYKGRTDRMNKYKEKFAVETDARSLAEAIDGADAFFGLSRKGVLKPEMVKSMNDEPIIFAMANPDPEILPEEVEAVRTDAIIATGRSDYPNQLNNVLGFPFIFRGALDVRAKKINLEMKLAAVKALSELAKEEVPAEVKLAYANDNFEFGKKYIIPTPFDKRALGRVSAAVAQAAMDSGVARININDMSEYKNYLEERLGNSASVMKSLRDRLKASVKKNKKKVKLVFAEGSETRVLNSVKVLLQDQTIEAVLLGEESVINSKLKHVGIKENHPSISIVNPATSKLYKKFHQQYSKTHQRNGVSEEHAEDLFLQPNYFGAMYVKDGYADALIDGPSLSYAACLKPILSVIGTKEKEKALGLYMMVFKNRILFLADCTTQISPTSEDLSAIAKNCSDFFSNMFKKTPEISFLSFSSFGSSNHQKSKLVKKAVEITKEKWPDLHVEGEMQADIAVNKAIRDKMFDFNSLKSETDILIFPELGSANIAYKLLSQLADVTPVGPILLPLNQNANIIPRSATVTEIVDICTVTALLTQS